MAITFLPIIKDVRHSNHQPYISIAKKYGVIRISAKASELMQLTEGDYVAFAKSDNGYYYIYKSDEANGYQLRAPNDSKNLLFNCINYATDIVADYKLNSPLPKTVRIAMDNNPLRHEGINLFPLHKQ